MKLGNNAKVCIEIPQVGIISLLNNCLSKNKTKQNKTKQKTKQNKNKNKRTNQPTNNKIKQTQISKIHIW